MTATADAGGQRGPFGAGFELFADMLGIGVATTLASLPVVTAPAAVSTACGQLRARSQGRRSPDGTGYFRALARRLCGPRGPADLLAGAVSVLVGALLVVDALLLRSVRGIPGTGIVTVTLILLAASLAAVCLRTVALPTSEHGWRPALRLAARATALDPLGSVLLVAAVAVAALCVWMLPVLVVLILGPLSLAATAVQARSPNH
ncbi:hypothetical protein CDG81_11880 [Actinopolyspora erythraea]|uniref:DUF624 domain-containing protein n=1 Tax=Actinopolyspora erythraea TaxID=414996 RepID=A0A099D597_9ACTN|nr:hypothetical protein [Actinopolyspora erythraea]ASU78863.1 hypothetical protein CDG81_11880 [Actinopolyspora erythraea]KGI81214.1 hypothetical protein IL38_11960 [Actinopolyspora erythraea]